MVHKVSVMWLWHAQGRCCTKLHSSISIVLAAWRSEASEAKLQVTEYGTSIWKEGRQVDRAPERCTAQTTTLDNGNNRTQWWPRAVGPMRSAGPGLGSARFGLERCQTGDRQLNKLAPGRVLKKRRSRTLDVSRGPATTLCESR
jgi:hypothetical protein